MFKSVFIVTILQAVAAQRTTSFRPLVVPTPTASEYSVSPMPLPTDVAVAGSSAPVPDVPSQMLASGVESNLPLGAVIGIALGSLVLLLAIIALGCVLTWRRREAKRGLAVKGLVQEYDPERKLDSWQREKKRATTAEDESDTSGQTDKQLLPDVPPLPLQQAPLQTIPQQPPQQMIQQTNQQMIQHATQPTIQQATQPTIQQTNQPTIQQTTQPTIQQTNQPTIQQPSQPTIQQPSQPTIQQPSQQLVDASRRNSVLVPFQPIPTRTESKVATFPYITADSTIVPARRTMDRMGTPASVASSTTIGLPSSPSTPSRPLLQQPQMAQAPQPVYYLRDASGNLVPINEPVQPVPVQYITSFQPNTAYVRA